MDTSPGIDRGRIWPELCCPRCKRQLQDEAPTAHLHCVGCGLAIRLESSQVSYDHAALLQQHDPSRYRLYRALCNNGFVSYHELANSSVSLPNRADVAEFGQFLASRVIDNAFVLDVGCGPLAVPGYLLPLQAKGARLMGLDVYPTIFSGFRILGCAEFLPIANRQLDAVVFATSLDHVCDLDRTFQEIRRVLRAGGGCYIWMSERVPEWRQFFFPDKRWRSVAQRVFVALPRCMASNVRHGWRLLYGVTHWFKQGRYWDYPNGSTFYCPPGAVDAFHSWFESPAEVASLAVRHGFKVACQASASNGVFLHFTV